MSVEPLAYCRKINKFTGRLRNFQELICQCLSTVYKQCSQSSCHLEDSYDLSSNCQLQGKKSKNWLNSKASSSLVPRPFEGRRKGLVHTVCACFVTLRGSDTIVYLSAHISAYVSVFSGCCWTLCYSTTSKSVL